MSAKTRQDEIADELWERADKIGWERAAVEVSGALATAEQTAEQRGHDLAAAQKLFAAAEQRAEAEEHRADENYSIYEAVRNTSIGYREQLAEAERLLAIAREALERIEKLDTEPYNVWTAVNIARKTLTQLDPQGGSGE